MTPESRQQPQSIADEHGPAMDASVAIVVLTHNRVHLLRQCIENVLSRVSPHAHDVIVWDNGSTDGTREYLDSLRESRLRVIHHPTNIGQNAYAEAFALTSADYFVKLDDDVIDAPAEWDKALLDSIQRLPSFGLLAASLVDDPKDASSYFMYHVRWHLYTEDEVNGVRLLRGPTGGGATITPRAANEHVGGYHQRRQPFWLEAADYIARLQEHGYEVATISDLKVHHAGGPYYSQEATAKQDYWDGYVRKVRRKNAIKRALLLVPFLASLNRREGWFEPPEEAEYVALPRENGYEVVPISEVKNHHARGPRIDPRKLLRRRIAGTTTPVGSDGSE